MRFSFRGGGEALGHTRLCDERSDEANQTRGGTSS
jgi:hypothetical protein